MLKHHEISIVTTNNNVETEGTELRSLTTGRKYRIKSFISFIMSIMKKIIRLQLSFSKMVGESLRNSQFKRGGCWSKKAIVHWFTDLGVQPRLLYPIISHDDIVVGSLFVHSVHEKHNGDWPPYCYMQYMLGVDSTAFIFSGNAVLSIRKHKLEILSAFSSARTGSNFFFFSENDRTI